MTHRKWFFLAILACIAALAVLPTAARAQSIEDIELRKQGEEKPMDFGFLGTYEGAMGLNRDRPEYFNSLYVAPQIKFGKTMRAQLNMTVNRAFLDRMDNAYGWYADDFSFEYAFLSIWKEELTGITLSGRARYYIPVSKQSRDAGSYGQARGYFKASTTLWKFYLACELNAQKYFSEYTTTPTTETPGTVEWFHQSGKDEYVENNTDYGLGETFTLGFTVFEGLDLSLIMGLYESRHYRGVTGLSESYGSSYLQQPRWTTWGYLYRYAADITYGLGSIPAIEKSPRLKDSLLSNIYLSFGYNILAPQLKNGGRTSNLDPFDPKFAQLYLDFTMVY
jgi:hypothetical protein